MKLKLPYLLRISVPEKGTFILLDHLFGKPLYAFYIVEIEDLDPADIEGTLMTPPFEFYGPFTTEADALILMDDLQSGNIPVD